MSYLNIMKTIVLYFLNIVAVFAFLVPILYSTPANCPYRIEPDFANSTDIQNLCGLFFNWQVRMKHEGFDKSEYDLADWDKICLRRML